LQSTSSPDVPITINAELNFYLVKSWQIDFNLKKDIKDYEYQLLLIVLRGSLLTQA